MLVSAVSGEGIDALEATIEDAAGRRPGRYRTHTRSGRWRRRELAASPYRGHSQGGRPAIGRITMTVRTAPSRADAVAQTVFLAAQLFHLMVVANSALSADCVYFASSRVVRSVVSKPALRPKCAATACAVRSLYLYVAEQQEFVRA